MQGIQPQISRISKTRSLNLSWLAFLIPIFLSLCALALWQISLSNIDISRVNDLGLASVLPPSFFLAFITLTASFCWMLHFNRLRTPVLLLHLVILILMVSTTVTLVEEVPRLHVAWRHAGFVEYIMRTGGLEHKVDAYFDWPIFFALSAFITKISGLDSPLSLLPWATVFFNLLYIGPLVMILRSATTDKRVIWLGVWFFYLTHWSGYDFFAPQALNYFFYMVILGILLQWFSVTSVQAGTGAWWQRFRFLAPLTARFSRWLRLKDTLLNVPSQPWQRIGLFVIVLLIFAASVSSHMLTPFFILGAVIVLIIFYRLTPKGLPLLMAIMIGVWLSFMSVSFLSGHMNMVTEGFGDVSNNIDANLGQRLRGSAEHIFVVSMRLNMALLIWGIAFLGMIRRVANRIYDITFALLAIVPFPFLALQAYGGEMMLRIYMFSLPPMLLFVAGLFYPSPARKTFWHTELAIGLLSLVLFVGFLFARYGNERMDYFTQQEADALHYLYTNAEHGSTLIAITENLPWRYQDYENYRYFRLIDLGGAVIRNLDLDAIERSMRNSRSGKSYLIITRSQEAWTDLFLGWEPDTVDRFEQALRMSDSFEVIFENDDATIFTLSNDQRG